MSSIYSGGSGAGAPAPAPMFSSEPGRMYPGSEWQVWLRPDKDGDAVWCDVMLLLPTDNGVAVLAAMPKDPPRWYSNAVVRRRPDL